MAGDADKKIVQQRPGGWRNLQHAPDFLNRQRGFTQMDTAGLLGESYVEAVIDQQAGRFATGTLFQAMQRFSSERGGVSPQQVLLAKLNPINPCSGRLLNPA